MKLLFFISSLQCGGAERVCVTLCNHWASRGWSVTVATFDDGARPPFFPLEPAVRRVALSLAGRSAEAGGSLLANLRRVARLRSLIRAERPDRILSFIDQTNVLAVLAAAGTGVPVTVAERTDPGPHAIPRVWRLLRRLTYPRAHAIVTQTRAAADHLPPGWRDRIAVVPNPVSDPPPPRAEGASALDARRSIVGMGRLEREKGFDLLLGAFAEIAKERPDWDLTIYGEGSERGHLEAQIARLALSGRAKLPGVTPEAGEALSRAHVFALPSRYEGFPNALCEAMARGVPAVAFDCDSGPREIIRDGVDGLLVRAEDAGALAEALSKLTKDAALRGALGERAREVAARYSVARIADLWEHVLRRGAPLGGASVEARA